MKASGLPPFLAQARRYAILCAIVAGLWAAWSAFRDLPLFMESYLLAFLFWWLTTLGCLGILLLYHLTGGRWGWLAKPYLSSAATTMPWLAIAFVPVALQVESLYPWASPASNKIEERRQLSPNSESTETVHKKHDFAPDVRRWYLNPLAFQLRAVGYFVIWIGLAVMLASGSNRTRSPRSPYLSALGMALLFLTSTFAAIDWGMSLEPGWFSTIYGPLLAISGALSGLALATLSAALCEGSSRQPPVAGHPEPQADLGNLLLAFLMLWAYFAFSQFLIIWSGNLPEENGWYLARATTGWQGVALGCALLGFVLPFALLLSRDLKHSPKLLAGVSGGIILTQFLHLAWIILPSFRVRLAAVNLADAAAWISFGGIWVVLFLRNLTPRLTSLVEEEGETA